MKPGDPEGRIQGSDIVENSPLPTSAAFLLRQPHSTAGPELPGSDSLMSFHQVHQGSGTASHWPNLGHVVVPKPVNDLGMECFDWSNLSHMTHLRLWIHEPHSNPLT